MFNDDDDVYKKYQLYFFNKLHGEVYSSTSRRTIQRDCEAGHERLVKDYFFKKSSLYFGNILQKVRISRHVFIRIVDALSDFNPYFQQRVNAL